MSSALDALKPMYVMNQPSFESRLIFPNWFDFVGFLLEDCHKMFMESFRN
jgi:hypothetical protein